MKSVLFRYFVHTAMLVFLSFAVLGVIFVLAASAMLGANNREKQENVAREASSLVLAHRENGELVPDEDFCRAAEAIVNVTSCEITVCTVSGEVLYTTLPEKLLRAGDIFGEPVWKLVSTEGWLLPYSEMSIGYDTLSRYVRNDDGTPAAILLIASDRHQVRTLTTSFLRVFLFTALLVMLIAFGTALIHSRTLARPLYDMAACARQFERGNFSARVDRWLLRDDEIGELAAAFNSMADALERGEELRRGFIGGVSHELRTPMTTISGYIEGILDGTVSPERQTETLLVVRDEIMRLSRLVKGMLELSRHQSGQMDIHPAPANITELSTRVLFGMEKKINQKKLQVEVLVPDDPVMILADADSMTQVMTNLLDNAVKFSDEEGTLSLSITRKSGRAYVVVRNSGQAIPPEDLPYIFDQFHKGDRSRSLDRSGLGLGLYLVKSILNAHNEDIFVMSENGMTEFMFSLPLTK